MSIKAEVVPIAASRQDCIADTVKVFEKLLERAKQGDFAAVSVAVVLTDLSVDSFWSKQDALPTMLGAVQVLNQRLLHGI